MVEQDNSISALSTLEATLPRWGSGRLTRRDRRSFPRWIPRTLIRPPSQPWHRPARRRRGCSRLV